MTDTIPDIDLGPILNPDGTPTAQTVAVLGDAARPCDDCEAAPAEPGSALCANCHDRAGERQDARNAS